MKVLYFLFLFLSFSISITAQDYTPVFPDRISFFCDNHDMIQGIKVDSSFTEGEAQIYEFFKNWNFDYDCILPNGIPWTGEKVVIKENNLFYFFNRAGDSILIKPFEKLNSKWLCFNYSDGSYIEAEFTDKYNFQLPYIEDTVKVMELIRKDAEGKILDDPVNNSTIMISKNYGFFSLLCLADFPVVDSTYSLRGITNPDIGRVYLGDKTINDFEVGDEFHSMYSYEYDNVSDYTYRYIDKIKRVLTKSINPEMETVEYSFYQYEKDDWTRADLTGEESGIYITEDTIFENYSIKINKYLVPGEAKTDSSLDQDYSRFFSLKNIDLDINRLMMIDSNVSLGCADYDSCWQLGFNNLIIIEKFVEGCGLFEEKIWKMDGAKSEYHIVYFKKGDKQWGTKLDVKEDPVQSVKQVKIYPNPVEKNEYVNIELPGSLIKSVRMIDLTGREQFILSEIYSGAFSFAISDVLPGVYILELRDFRGEVYYKKLIVK